MSKKWKGTLKFEDLGSGVWVLETKSGKHQLDGDIPDDLDGAKVVVEGNKAGLLGFGMVGGSGIRVTKVERA